MGILDSAKNFIKNHATGILMGGELFLAGMPILSGVIALFIGSDAANATFKYLARHRTPRTVNEQFIEEKWRPFLDKLEAIIEKTGHCTKLGYDLADRLPPQSEINKLAEECYALTTEYYGKGQNNIAVMYQFLIRANIAAGVTFYEPLDNIKSKDGYLQLNDMETLVRQSNDYTSNVRANYKKTGGRIFRGRSAIDNTTPPNIFLQEDGRRIVARRGVMKAIVKFLNLLNKENPNRSKIENAGQLSQDAKEFLWQEVCTAIPVQRHRQEITDFVDFLHAKPGEYFQGDKNNHRKMLYEGLAQGDLKAVPPAIMQQTVPHRYVGISYTRRTPLQVSINGDIVTLRENGIKEVVFQRANEGHYLRDHHGMSLASGSQTRVGNLFFSQDPAAFNRSNRYPDIEWLIIQALAYNSQDDLPGTRKVMVGRNSYTGSSIQQTAHGQEVCATLEQFPHYAAVNKPQQMREFDATIDFIQLGTKQDSSCLKIITNDLRAAALLEFVNKLIIAMQKQFRESIDFQIQIIPAKDGRFALILIPFEMLQKISNDVCQNSAGIRSDSINVRPHLHMGHAAGCWAATLDQLDLWFANGHEYLQRLFDFTSLTGTHEFMQNFVRDYVSVSSEQLTRTRGLRSDVAYRHRPAFTVLS